MNETRDWLSLISVSGLGPAGFWGLVNHFGSPGAVLNASAAALKQVPGIRAGRLDALSRVAELNAAAEAEMDRLDCLKCRALIYPDADYPELLRNTVNPPPVLYVRGKTALLNKPAVAMVGSRAATSYGRRVAFSLARDLAQNRIVIVSGLAMGIDAEAHAGSLAGSGSTIAVLGCGLDVIYPRSNSKLYSQIIDHGLLVTEYPLGTKPDGFRFPARNRIIAGISLGVVVVEAARKSGSLITVQYALDEGREVFAVPGQIDSRKSGGTHWLLQQGASLIVSMEDILYQLQIEPVVCAGPALGDNDMELDGDTAVLLSHLECYPKRRDELLQLSGLSPAKLSEQLLLLELEGLVDLLPGDEVRKTC